MRIFVITSSYPRHAHDHAGNFVAAQVAHLTELGHEVEVFCWDDKLEATRQDPWPVHRVRYAPSELQYLFYGGGAPENLSRHPSLALFALPALAAMLARLLSRDPPDVVMGHWFVPGGALARLVAGVWGVPSIVVGHSGGLQLLASLPRAAARLAVRTLCRGTTTLPSRPLAELARSLAPDAHPLVMPMGVEAGVDTLEVAREPRAALFLGRLEPIKGAAVAIEATRRAGWKLRLAGEGSLRRELEPTASDHAEFLGFVGGRDKWRAIDRSTISLHPSVPQSGRHEGLPVALLECALRGTFPLVSGAPGVEEWLVDAERQVCAPGDVDAFAERLGWWDGLAPDKQKGLAEAQRAMVEPLRWERWIHAWDRLLRQL